MNGARILVLAFLAVTFAACSDDDGGGGSDGDGDVDGDADGDGGPACDLDCGGLASALPWDQQSALPTCEDNGAWSQPPETLNIQNDPEGRVTHWETTLRYANNHQFVVRYDVSSFCADGTIEELRVDAESFDPMGTWSCTKFFICM